MTLIAHQPRLMEDPNACPQRGGDKPHLAIKVAAGPIPDSDWWCVFCGTSGLPAPEAKSRPDV